LYDLLHRVGHIARKRPPVTPLAHGAQEGGECPRLLAGAAPENAVVMALHLAATASTKRAAAHVVRDTPDRKHRDTKTQPDHFLDGIRLVVLHQDARLYPEITKQLLQHGVNQDGPTIEDERLVAEIFEPGW
jgi:hypothetical protein